MTCNAPGPHGLRCDSYPHADSLDHAHTAHDIATPYGWGFVVWSDHPPLEAWYSPVVVHGALSALGAVLRAYGDAVRGAS